MGVHFFFFFESAGDLPVAPTSFSWLPPLGGSFRGAPAAAARRFNGNRNFAVPHLRRSDLDYPLTPAYPGLTAGATLVPRLRRCDSGNPWPAIIISWPAIIKSIASAPGAKRRHHGSPGREAGVLPGSNERRRCGTKNPGQPTKQV
mgnify:CR=1 FL=1